MRSTDWMPATMPPERAMTWNPGATPASSSESPWVSSTFSSACRPAKSGEVVSISMVNWPSSRASFFSTLPLKMWFISCMP